MTLSLHIRRLLDILSHYKHTRYIVFLSFEWQSPHTSSQTPSYKKNGNRIAGEKRWGNFFLNVIICLFNWMPYLKSSDVSSFSFLNLNWIYELLLICQGVQILFNKLFSVWSNQHSFRSHIEDLTEHDVNVHLIFFLQRTILQNFHLREAIYFLF